MVRLATFNAENLFARYNFKRHQDPVNSDCFTINQTAYDINNDDEKRITAKAIKEVDADILALQEIENLRVLDTFVSEYLQDMGYKYRILVDALDPRSIDVALISKYPIIHIRTWRSERNAANTAFLFSRDCLEVDIDVNGKSLTVYVNHFKSMAGGRDKTYARRKEQADKVMSIVEKRWADNQYQGNYAVVGDLNDYLEDHSSLIELVSYQGLENISERLPEEERWTHHWARGKEYRQLDYILLSPQLAENNANSLPQVMRKGLPSRAEKYQGPRFDYIGDNRPKASDHCPLYIDIELS
ncbi:endonuclease/exonuclease/phosphatase family protein [Photobacterium sp. J15]|uniref:endonuclease/exonuclease/phosphatase family protein n=1 Tax=Photobacterium sp. J15 TaxID=265901 RepID=UPI0007E4B166|nr:endonuclease/exonuclease/phosphatase family protein [Photobacterium sp. J15]